MGLVKGPKIAVEKMPNVLEVFRSFSKIMKKL
jgi:hypothetical protein